MGKKKSTGLSKGQQTISSFFTKMVARPPPVIVAVMDTPVVPPPILVEEEPPTDIQQQPSNVIMSGCEDQGELMDDQPSINVASLLPTRQSKRKSTPISSIDSRWIQFYDPIDQQELLNAQPSSIIAPSVDVACPPDDVARMPTNQFTSDSDSTSPNNNTTTTNNKLLHWYSCIDKPELLKRQSANRAMKTGVFIDIDYFDQSSDVIDVPSLDDDDNQKHIVDMDDENNDEDWKPRAVQKKRKLTISDKAKPKRVIDRSLIPPPPPIPAMAKEGYPTHVIIYATINTLALNKMLFCCSNNNMVLCPILHQYPTVQGPFRPVHKPSHVDPLPLRFTKGLLQRGEIVQCRKARLRCKKNPMHTLPVKVYLKRIEQGWKPTPALPYKDRKLALQNLHHEYIAQYMFFQPIPSTMPTYHNVNFQMAKSWHTITSHQAIVTRTQLEKQIETPLHILITNQLKKSQEEEAPK